MNKNASIPTKDLVTPPSSAGAVVVPSDTFEASALLSRLLLSFLLLIRRVDTVTWLMTSPGGGRAEVDAVGIGAGEVEEMRMRGKNAGQKTSESSTAEVKVDSGARLAVWSWQTVCVRAVMWGELSRSERRMAS